MISSRPCTQRRGGCARINRILRHLWISCLSCRIISKAAAESWAALTSGTQSTSRIQSWDLQVLISKSTSLPAVSKTKLDPWECLPNSNRIRNVNTTKKTSIAKMSSAKRWETTLSDFQIKIKVCAYNRPVRRTALAESISKGRPRPQRTASTMSPTSSLITVATTTSWGRSMKTATTWAACQGLEAPAVARYWILRLLGRTTREASSFKRSIQTKLTSPSLTSSAHRESMKQTSSAKLPKWR